MADTTSTEATKIYCVPSESNSALNPILSSLLTNQGKSDSDPMTMMAMMNNGGFGGAWNNPMMYIMYMWLFRYMNGWGGDNAATAAAATNTEALNYNNRQISELRQAMDNNHNNDLVMEAIKGNGAAVHELATNLNIDFNTVSQALCGIKSAVENVGANVGFSAERVINAVNQGDTGIISAIQSTACATQKAILEGNYQNQLATERQTGIITSQMSAQHSADMLQDCQNQGALMSRIDQLANGITQGFAQVGYAAQQNTQAIINSQTAQTQRVLDQMCANTTQSLRDQVADKDRELQTQTIIASLKSSGCGCNA